MRERVDILGVLFDNVDFAGAQNRLCSALAGGTEQLSLFTPNPEIVMLCDTVPELRDILNSPDGTLTVADGIGIIKAARILGTPLPCRIPGVELGEAMLAFCASRGGELPVYLLGGKPGVAEQARERLSGLYPGLCVCGVHDGYFEFSGAENNALLEDICSSRAVLLLCCLGAPAQEKWISQNRDKLPGVRVLAGLGGSIDVYAGSVRRAPAIFRQTGLEWFYRLASQPSRIKRMVKLPGFLVRAIRYRRRAAKGHGKE